MLRYATPLLGRWKGWDHVKGITKSGGAIHIRHTHGSKGRYQRLSTKYGIRDGRRHQMNHMRGGLGIKLGGGLFGLRIPRQFALSTMTKEELDLEVHGHPNITNPYRHIIEEHPDLEGVVSNPALRASFVLAMPIIPRVPRSDSEAFVSFALHEPPVSTGSSAGGAADGVILPKRWAASLSAIEELVRGLEGLGGPTEGVATTAGTAGALPEQLLLVLATTTSSVSMLFDAHAPADGNEGTRRMLLCAMRALYEHYASGVQVLPEEDVRSSGSGDGGAANKPKPSIVVVDGLQMPMGAHRPHRLFRRSAEIASPGVVDSDKSSRSLLLSSSGAAAPVAAANAASPIGLSVERVGVEGWIHRLRDLEPTALRLQTALPVVVASPARDQFAKGQRAKRRAPEYAPVGDAKHRAEGAESLMHWHFYNSDPRSHFSDALPHCARPLHVNVVIECVTPVAVVTEPVPLSTGQRTSAPLAFRGIVGHQTRKLMQSAGFRCLRESPSQLLPVLRKWSSHGTTATSSPTAIGGSGNDREGPARAAC